MSLFLLQLFVKYRALVAQADRHTQSEVARLTKEAARAGPRGEAAELELELLEDAELQYIKVRGGDVYVLVYIRMFDMCLCHYVMLTCVSVFVVCAIGVPAHGGGSARAAADCRHAGLRVCVQSFQHPPPHQDTEQAL